MRLCASRWCLLKNEGRTLPLIEDTPLIYVGGEAADDIGIQIGGWSTQWQGEAGRHHRRHDDPASGIEEVSGPGATGRSTTRPAGSTGFTDAEGRPFVADVGIAVVAERPYAEGVGDSADLALPPADLAMVQRVRDSARRLVLVVLAGRPVIITDLLPLADAVVVAWLPGSEGQGVADVLFGDAPFTGTLPYTWPRSVDQLPVRLRALPADGPDAPLFPAGFGLTTEP